MAHEKVLVVDNDEEYLNLIVSDLQRHEYMVKSTTDGAEALNWILDSNDFDILVTDLLIPNINGDELVHKARSSDENLQAIIITASESAQDAIRTMREYGAFDYLIKPLDQMSQLRNAVERAAQERRSQIQKQTHMQQLLLESSKLETMISSSKDGILLFDQRGKINLYNSAATAILDGPLSIDLPLSEALPSSLQTVLSNWQGKFDAQFSIVELGLKSNHVLSLRMSPMIEEPISKSGYLLVLTLQSLQDLPKDTPQIANTNPPFPEEPNQNFQNSEDQEFEAELQRAADRLSFLADLKQVNKQAVAPSIYVKVQEIADQLAYHWTSTDVVLNIRVDQGAKISTQGWALEQLVAEILIILKFAGRASTQLVLHLNTSHEFLWLTVTETEEGLVKLNPFTHNSNTLHQSGELLAAEINIRNTLFGIQGQIWWSPHANRFPSLAIPLSVS